MPRVLILGATGYLGSRIAQLLVLSGQHSVYGIARSHEKALQLSRGEIQPVLCPDPINDPEAYLAVIRSRCIDIVVDVSGANQQSHTILQNVRLLGQQRIDANSSRGIRGPKLGYIYCSGTWVHGSSENPVTDLDLVGPDAATPPEELVSWRVDLENEILKSDGILDVMILRPALIYGRESTIWSPFITPIIHAAKDNMIGPLVIPLEARARPGLVHVDDAAAAFLKAVEKLPLLNGADVYPVFDLVTSQESVREIFDALAACCGYEGLLQLKGHGGDLFRKAMSTTFRGTSARAELLLGWRPTRLGGFVKDMDLYLSCFAANLEVL